MSYLNVQDDKSTRMHTLGWIVICDFHLKKMAAFLFKIIKSMTYHEFIK